MSSSPEITTVLVRLCGRSRWERRNPWDPCGNCAKKSTCKIWPPLNQIRLRSLRDAEVDQHVRPKQTFQESPPKKWRTRNKTTKTKNPLHRSPRGVVVMEGHDETCVEKYCECSAKQYQHQRQATFLSARWSLFFWCAWSRSMQHSREFISSQTHHFRGQRSRHSYDHKRSKSKIETRVTNSPGWFGQAFWTNQHGQFNFHSICAYHRTFGRDFDHRCVDHNSTEVSHVVVRPSSAVWVLTAAFQHLFVLQFFQENPLAMKYACGSQRDFESGPWEYKKIPHTEYAPLGDTQCFIP